MYDFDIQQILLLYSLDYPDLDIELTEQSLLSTGDESFDKGCWSRVRIAFGHLILSNSQYTAGQGLRSHFPHPFN